MPSSHWQKKQAMADTWFWVLAAIATFCVGASKGGLPGVGILAVPILSQAISPVVAAGLLLPLYIVSDIYGLWLYRKSYDLWNIKLMVAAGTIGIAIGWGLAYYNTNAEFGERLAKFIVGIVGLIYAIDMVMKLGKATQTEARPADVPRGLFWGSVAGFTSFVAHSGGPPYQMFVLPQRLEKMVYAGTTTIVFTFINLLKVPPYWMLGQINTVSLKTCIYLTPVALFGAFAGYHLTRLMPGKLFFRLVEVALILLSMRLFYEAIFRAH
jgi:uncharacterized protein